VTRLGDRSPRVEAETIVYRVVHHNGSLVFAYESDAERVARIHEALNTARTWGEFRAKMPSADYSEVVQRFDEDGERRPRASDPFKPDSVAGWSDGDYPEWLQHEMGRVVPDDLLRKYGTRANTMVNGSFWMIPPDHAELLANELRARGYRVVQRESLGFH
jgi:hypothetical protein